jgi:hypothetical protein
LSRAVWRAYTHPASSADSLEVNTEGWRREGDRAAFPAVLPALSRPHLAEGRTLVQSYIPVEETAHRVGRALHAIGDAALSEQVAADVQADLDPVERAERGDLTGRAGQAVHLTREDASPLQVAAADALLDQHPLGHARLFTEVDPTAAAVAAAHWLQAAAHVVAELADTDPAQVVLRADDIEALAVETPTLVLERLATGETPREVVTDLVAEAMAVAEGRVPDLAQLLQRVEEIGQRASKYGTQADHLREAMLSELRITPLDPSRPSRDLLEDLLDGLLAALPRERGPRR